VKSPKKAGDAKNTPETARTGSKTASGDDFVIGVQDWRDPDLVGSSGAKESENGVKTYPKMPDENLDPSRQNNPPPPAAKAGKKHTGGALQDIPEYVPALRGGSITPGSGEYGAKLTPLHDSDAPQDSQINSVSNGDKGKGLLTTIFGDDEEDIEFLPIKSIGPASDSQVTDDSSEDGDDDDCDYCEGLWVTLTPTSGATPFLDTLLVLVVSPLVTLTIVYALLLVRSRIRRRRWRAPKSVVERLPVRTYHTITSSGSQSPRLPSPSSSSPTAPLLQQSTPVRPRPRSRTTTGIPEPGDLIRVNSTPLQVPTPQTRVPHEHEKNSSVSSEWKKYMGKQVECVVCLEEYIDGVSRVMSLPCGHEFHVDCITPWLTTRRRTCPICKGDVVRSLARGSPSSPRYEPYHDDSDDDVQSQVADTSDDSPSAVLSPSRNVGEEQENDLEQGFMSPMPTRVRGAGRQRSWRSLISSSLGSSSRSSGLPQDDRNR